jgi:ribosomal protein S18 acetylase RimI-like enzyme
MLRSSRERNRYHDGRRRVILELSTFGGDRMSETENIQLILQQNAKPEYFSAYASSTTAGMRAWLADPEVRVIERPNSITVIDEYNVGPRKLAEISGPYPAVPNATPVLLDRELTAILQQLPPDAMPQFFIDQANSLHPLLEMRGFTCRPQHIWQMTPLPLAGYPVHVFTTVPPRTIANQVEALHAKHFASRDITDETSPEQPLFVCLEGRTVVGYAQGGLDDNHLGHLLFVAVAASYQRRGIARSLMATLYAYLNDFGATRIELVQAASAAAAGKTYAACGFTHVRALVSLQNKA